MGYSGQQVIERFIRNAGQRRHSTEPGKRPGTTRQAFIDGRGSSLFYRADARGRVIEIMSYGNHFPLARLLLHPSGRRKIWLLNGDRWPGGGFGRTNEHNDIAREYAQASGTPCFIVPFSAIRAAGIDPDTIRPVDVDPERREAEDHSVATLAELPAGHDKVHVWIDQDSGQVIHPPIGDNGYEAHPQYSDHTWRVSRHRLGESGYGWYTDQVDGPAFTDALLSHYVPIEPGPDGRYHWTTSRHWLGGSLFRARYRDGGGGYNPRTQAWSKPRNRWAYFVTSFDYNEPHPLWFMSQLAHGVRPTTIAEAVDSLTPPEVRYAVAAGIPVERQGDLFAIQAVHITIPLDSDGHGLDYSLVTRRELMKQGGQLVPVTREYGRKTGRYVNDSHTATRVIAMPDGELYVRGIMRHRPEGRRPDHVNLVLGDRTSWWRIVPNNQARSVDANPVSGAILRPRSWSLGGDVD
jgi:hypothetical protein